MQIVEKAIDELSPYAGNPRDNDEAVPYVANSIREFGFKVPIIIDSEGVIVAGHTRYKAAQEIGLVSVPCIVADDLTPEQVKAFRLADNKVSELAEWNETLLEIELGEILDIEMGDFGFIGELEIGEMEPIDVDEVGGNEGSVSKITVDGKSWQISHDEAELFRDAMEQYIEDNGVSFGFIRDFLDD